MFPKFKSHCSNSNKLYFSPELSVKKLYELYLEKEYKPKIGITVFREQLKKYNISIYVPRKHTCAKCDQHRIMINNNLSEEQLKKAKDDHQKHLIRAEDARKELKEKGKEAQEPESKLLCFSFDFQKTQPIPYLNTSVAYYKRKLWLYNLGINTRNNNNGYMYLWDETNAKKGNNEVASSILAFFQQIDLKIFEEIHTFSDCCGGQNRNKNIVSFFMYICETTHIRTWTHTFLETGHSYLPNDTDFGKIEKMKRNTFGIYSVEQWAQMIKNCKFSVCQMKDKFFDISKLRKCLKFTGNDSTGEKLKWHNLKWFETSKDTPYEIKFKYSNCTEETPKTIDLRKRKNSVSLQIFNWKRFTLNH